MTFEAKAYKERFIYLYEALKRQKEIITFQNKTLNLKKWGKCLNSYGPFPGLHYMDQVASQGKNTLAKVFYFQTL